jgi:hypothetical protein
VRSFALSCSAFDAEGEHLTHCGLVTYCLCENTTALAGVDQLWSTLTRQ